MPRFAANLSMMYTEHDFLDRFAAASADGFEAVEYLFPYAYDAKELRRRLDDNGLRQVLFNAPPGAWDDGERGIAALPGREAEMRAGIDLALQYAAELDCTRVHVMAGLVQPDATPAQSAKHRDTYLANLAWAAERAATMGVDILVEPINGRDMPGYFLNRQADAHAVVRDVGASNLKVQLDLYHCQIVEGDLTATLRRDVPTGRVGHLQIAGVPDRHEPDVGELNVRHLFGVIDDLGFDGWIGCEYIPRAGTSEGLAWLTDYRGENA
ncbi:2-oxo-tetronate isomerase [Streptomyces himalayensis]|uniref:Hydroxypyruvate isomerase family protein n=1 Tax=Streptomyces himalayensis subsp. himalayensis TaxID=2756131 RepID=A0A7W0I882_9ACTN|nr:2-oxo-tetronate isomerase [Streptomyces himalayensis]MBA2945786.1 hydroxypyruvate isomerase family protein [Streptomyces himalayensis subsp. himalayensis]